MIGLYRLNNIQNLFEIILADKIPGDLIETGSCKGGAVIFMRSLLKAYQIEDRVVWFWFDVQIMYHVRKV